MDCKSCGASIEATKPCPYCGAPASEVEPSTVSLSINPADQADFEVFNANGGKYKPIFGLWSFLFGPLWYFYKGMWGKGLAILLAYIFLGVTFIVPLALYVYQAFCGKYDYYLFVKSGGKQPLDNGVFKWW